MQDNLQNQLDHMKVDYLRACALVAEMHAAAVGEVRGPSLGVVEDVAALRKERDELREKLATATRLDGD